MKKNSFSLINFVFYIINIIGCILLLFSYLANFITPDKFTFAAYCGMLYPYLLATNTFFVIYWALQRKRFAFLSLIGILIGYTFIPRLYPFNNQHSKNNDSNFVKILSYNVHVFGIYEGNNTYKDSIISFIAEQQPDILCFQEYFQDNKTYKHDSIFKSILQTKHKYLELDGDNHKIGLAVFSKYPIIHAETLNFQDSSNNKAVLSDICIANDTFRVYNIHFQSINFEKEDYLFTSKFSTKEINMKSEEMQSGSKRILKKLKQGYVVRSEQVKQIVEHIKSSPYPVVVCGDFNDIPWSYTYQQISKLLTDAFVSSGKGFGNTFFINNRYPFRIDFIFYNERTFQAFDFKVHHIKYSDHLPIHTLLKPIEVK
ncbi:MAG: endonuclease/exonuclease/phosphatase family protein [Bacteroidales bacterium]|jgi:endonuclease/exonuclease/phosphatase family metal-dependent hydrolase|nr:endonuclease/exonuclease/phosphatase family protein [Bacteroidales bacterium]MDD3691315.1 endonuclease/exonuclease/phosphatase family protein [Bacteroidales bacterium]MDD4044079.1 endonuclease/exonuclease/phosphatase family protein [Bacteroidales bacterium]NLO41784.1 endonuclease/exonuclease/phosphatase family protein [Bacteroidales bacterium]